MGECVVGWLVGGLVDWLVVLRVCLSTRLLANLYDNFVSAC